MIRPTTADLRAQLQTLERQKAYISQAPVCVFQDTYRVYCEMTDRLAGLLAARTALAQAQVVVLDDWVHGRLRVTGEN